MPSQCNHVSEVLCRSVQRILVPGLLSIISEQFTVGWMVQYFARILIEIIGKEKSFSVVGCKSFVDIYT